MTMVEDYSAVSLITTIRDCSIFWEEAAMITLEDQTVLTVVEVDQDHLILHPYH